VLSKPVSPEALQRTVVELRALAAEPRTGRDPVGELSVEGLADRIAAEVRRGLLEAVEPSARNTSVGFGDGADVMAAVWGAVARVRELVTLRSSGAVRFDSSGPEGAVPFAAWGSDERRAGERGSIATDSRASDSVSLRGRRIVVADDDPAVVWFMSDLLRAMGVEVLEAHDGARALALTYDAWPDLVVSDVLMPKLDGFSLCHEIKRDVAVRDVPVILLSWKEDLLQRVRELGGAADGYLRKEAAAATVAERLREVLRARARVEERVAAGGDARGRLDGLTPRLILELASAGQRDVRVGIRDAVYLYEVQVRGGRLCSATRSATDGSFERGEAVLAALLGVSAGRFTVEPDSTPFRGDFAGSPAQILKAPIERARRALDSIAAGALVGVTRVQIDAAAVDGYLGCTPEPARGLLQKIIDGASPRELITTGAVAPRLLEAVLSDVARRGAIGGVERMDSAPPPQRGSNPPVVAPREAAGESSAREVIAPPPAITSKPPEISEDDEGWFSFQVDAGIPAPASAIEPAGSNVVLPEPPAPLTAKSAKSPEPPRVEPAKAALAPMPVEAKASAMPFSPEVTPSANHLLDAAAEGVFAGAATLQGVGSLPAVRKAESAPAAPTPQPKPKPTQPSLTPAALAEVRAPASPGPLPAAIKAEKKPEMQDAVAVALTEASPAPMPARPIGATQVMAAVSLPEAVAVGAVTNAANAASQIEARADTRPPSSRRTLKSKDDVRAPTVAAKREQAPGSAELTQVARSKARSSWVGWVFTLLLAFAVSYVVVSYFKADVMDLLGHSSSSPASPR
jgi:CheY-like chemotaxis protein